MKQYSFKQFGFSLVELLIAMTLGLVVIGGIITAFIASKNVYLTHQALSQIQETSRLAMSFLEKDIRMTGYMGCASRFNGKTIANTLKNSSDIKYNFEQAIQGYTKTSLPDVQTVFEKVPVDNSDILVTRSASGAGVPVTKSNDAAKVFVEKLSSKSGFCNENKDQISGFCPADIVVISDCTKSRVFQITSIDVNGNEAGLLHNTGIHTPGNDTGSWGNNISDYLSNYGVGSHVMLANSNIYYVAKGSVSPFSLWKNHNGVDLELLEGVEKISFQYGEDTTGVTGDAPDEYRSAADVTNWNRVVSVEVEILIASSEDYIVSEPQPYTFKGVSATPNDRRLRRVFKNTIGIRSRLN